VTRLYSEIQGNSKTVKSKVLVQDIREIVNKAKAGKKVTVYLDNIKANVAGTIEDVGNLIYELN
jgi:hypothetical protein